MAKEVFRRIEKKYLLDSETAEKLRQHLNARMERDKYNEGGALYTIANLYYDTPDKSLIRTSLNKPVYKEKLRMRGYGVPGLNDLVFVEMKKKYDGMVNKRRTQMTLSEAYELLNTGKLKEVKPYMNPQVIREIEYFLNRLPLEPMVYLAYDREAWFAKDDPGLRVTFDTGIRTRHSDLRLENGEYGEKLMRDNIVLMEVKTETTVPYWLASLLNAFSLHPSSFSKYGSDHLLQTELQKIKGGHIPCLCPRLQNCLALPAMKQ